MFLVSDNILDFSLLNSKYFYAVLEMPVNSDITVALLREVTISCAYL